MSSFYIKNRHGEFVPVEIGSLINNKFNNNLIILRIGTDERPATADDLDVAYDQFSKAEILSTLDNVSIILSSHNISIEMLDPKDIENKTMCLQIVGGDVTDLDKKMKAIYEALKARVKNITVLPTPLKIKEYKEVVETLERCKLKKSRRSNSRN